MGPILVTNPVIHIHRARVSNRVTERPSKNQTGHTRVADPRGLERCVEPGVSADWLRSPLRVLTQPTQSAQSRVLTAHTCVSQGSQHGLKPVRGTGEWGAAYGTE